MLSKVSDSLVYKAISLLISGDNLKAAKVKLLRENNFLESTSLWFESELKIDINSGLA